LIAEVKAFGSDRTCKFMDSRLLNFLVCPRDHTELRIERNHLYCAAGHNYQIVDDIPVSLMAEKDQTIGIASASLRAAQNSLGGCHLEDVG